MQQEITDKKEFIKMPRIIGPVPSDRWEKEVRRQLSKQLPDNWVVICNVSWALKDNSGFVRDGQADFVVLVPEIGLAVVEVKGSKLIRVAEDGTWWWITRNSQGKVFKEKKITKIPPEQACSNLHKIAVLLKNEFGLKENDPFPGLHAWLVVYPNGIVECELDTYDSSTIVAKNRMHQLGSVIKGALLAKGNENTGKKFRNDLVDISAKALTNQRFRVVAVDTEQELEEDETNIDELTRQQFAALRGAFELPRVAIIGPAGSGKTLLAIWKLSALIEEGKNAIFVCFNKVLAKSLSLKNPNLASAIVSVDSLFWSKVTDHRGMGEKDFYSNILPSRVESVVYSLSEDEKYDAIIIDEGQDFGDERIIALYQLLKDNDSQWLYFADNKQDLYGQGTDETLGAEVTFRLYHNCRNTKRVNAATNKVCSSEVMSMPGVPSGEVPSVSIRKTEVMAQQAWNLVKELSPDGGAVIISPYKLENSCMKNSLKAHGLNLTEDLNLLGEPGFIFYSTVKSFKGLEAKHIIFVEADKPKANTPLTEEDMYVAFTRATARLDVVTSSSEASQWFSDLLTSID